MESADARPIAKWSLRENQRLRPFARHNCKRFWIVLLTVYGLVATTAASLAQSGASCACESISVGKNGLAERRLLWPVPYSRYYRPEKRPSRLQTCLHIVDILFALPSAVVDAAGSLLMIAGKSIPFLYH